MKPFIADRALGSLISVVAFCRKSAGKLLKRFLVAVLLFSATGASSFANEETLTSSTTMDTASIPQTENPTRSYALPNQPVHDADIISNAVKNDKSIPAPSTTAEDDHRFWSIPNHRYTGTIPADRSAIWIEP